VQISVFSQITEHYLRININNRSDFETLSRIVSVDKVTDDEVIAYANSNELEKLKKSNFKFTELEHPSVQAGKAITMAETIAEMVNWDRYPTYSVYNQLMLKFKTDYPNLCKLDTIGTSILNKNILALNITANVNVPQAKPEVLFSSTIHGNETTGWILCMRLADFLLSNYGVIDRITNMLDSISIFIAPNTNPDGTYHLNDNSISNARRNNYNGFDLNRNFPDPHLELIPNEETWQKETMIMMSYAETRNFILSINYHAGAELANYPWDAWTISQKKHADHNWYDQICRQYATLAQSNAPPWYFRDMNKGVAHGASWFSVAGGRQDYMNYWHHCREITLEVSENKMPQSENLPIYWNYNYEAMLTFIENVKYGIRGFVTNTDGKPLNAKITVVGHDADNSHVITNPQFGNYYRMIQPGTYTLIFESHGFDPQIISEVVALQNRTTILNVKMKESTSDAKRVNIYPNPAKTEITISISNLNGSANIEIYTITGQKIRVIQTLNDKQMFMLTELGITHSGIYLLRVITDDFVETTKLIVE